MCADCALEKGVAAAAKNTRERVLDQNVQIEPVGAAVVGKALRTLSGSVSVEIEV